MNDEQKKQLKRAIRELENAARDHAFKGATRLDDHEAIELRYKDAKRKVKQLIDAL